MSYELAEVRLGPVQTENIAFREVEDGINRVIRALNDTPDLDVYTKAEVDRLIALLDTGEVDLSSYITAEQAAELYATLEALNELAVAVEGKADAVHNHDTRYYTQTQINSMRNVPFYDADGVYDPIPLNVHGTLSFFDSNGNLDEIRLNA